MNKTFLIDGWKCHSPKNTKDSILKHASHDKKLEQKRGLIVLVCFDCMEMVILDEKKNEDKLWAV